MPLQPLRLLSTTTHEANMKFTETDNGFIMHIDLALSHFDTAFLSRGETVLFDGHEYIVDKFVSDYVYFLSLGV